MSDIGAPAPGPGFRTTQHGRIAPTISSTPKDRPPSAVRCNPVHDVTSYAATSPGIWIAHRTSVFPLHAAQSFGRWYTNVLRSRSPSVHHGQSRPGHLLGDAYRPDTNTHGSLCL